MLLFETFTYYKCLYFSIPVKPYKPCLIAIKDKKL